MVGFGREYEGTKGFLSLCSVLKKDTFGLIRLPWPVCGMEISSLSASEMIKELSSTIGEIDSSDTALSGDDIPYIRSGLGH
jgi:hypothetical protein